MRLMMVTYLLVNIIRISQSEILSHFKLDRLYELEGSQIMNFKCKQIPRTQLYVYIEADDSCTIQLNNTFIKEISNRGNQYRDILYSSICHPIIKINTKSHFTIIQNFINPQTMDISYINYIKSAGPIFYDVDINKQIDFSIHIEKIETSNTYFSVLLAQGYYSDFNNTMQFYNVKENIYVIDLLPGNYNCIIIGSTNLRYTLLIGYRKEDRGFILNSQKQIPEISTIQLQKYYIYLLFGLLQLQCQSQDLILIEPHLNHWILLDGFCYLSQIQNTTILLYYEAENLSKSLFINIITLIIPPYIMKLELEVSFYGIENQQLQMNSLQQDHCTLSQQTSRFSCTVSTELKLIEIYVVQQQYSLKPRSSIVAYFRANQITQLINIIDDKYSLKCIIGECSYSYQNGQIRVNSTENTIILLYYIITKQPTKLLCLHQVYKIINADYSYQFNNPKNQPIQVYIYPKEIDYDLQMIDKGDQIMLKDRKSHIYHNVIVLKFHAILKHCYLSIGIPPLSQIYTQQILVFFFLHELVCYKVNFQFSFHNLSEQANLTITEMYIQPFSHHQTLAQNLTSSCFIHYTEQLTITFIRREIIGIQIFSNQYQPMTSTYYFIYSQCNQLILKLKSTSQNTRIYINIQSSDQIDFIDYPNNMQFSESDLNFQIWQFHLVDLSLYDCLEIDCILKLQIDTLEYYNQFTFQTCSNIILYYNVLTKFNDTLNLCLPVQSQHLLIIDGIVEYLFDNTFLVCHSELCIIYMSSDLNSDETIQILQNNDLFIDMNHLNCFNLVHQSKLIMYSHQQQQIQIHSNTSFYLQRCEYQQQQVFKIYFSTKINIQSGFYCFNPTNKSFFITAFTFPTFLYESIEFYNQDNNEWQFSDSAKAYAVIQFKLNSLIIKFQYQNISYSFKEKNNLVLKLNSQRYISIDGNASIKVHYTDHPCYFSKNPHFSYTQTDSILLNLNTQCNPIEIYIQQGQNKYTLQNSLLILQNLKLTAENDPQLHIISNM